MPCLERLKNRPGGEGLFQLFYSASFSREGASGRDPSTFPPAKASLRVTPQP